MLNAMKHTVLVFAIFLSGCPQSVTRGDAGDELGDAGTIDETDAGPVDADIIVRGSAISEQEGQTARVRIVNTAIFTASDFRSARVVAGSFEITFPRAMPRENFGVFADGWFDNGDSTCQDSEAPFRLF